MRAPCPGPISALAVIALALMVTSCATDSDIGPLHYSAAANHPIAVEPHTVTVALPFAAAGARLSPQDDLRLHQFAAHYLASGHGAVSIVASEGAGSQPQIRYFGKRLTELGVAPQRILVGTDGAVAQGHVELRYMTYEAQGPRCGDWSDASRTGDNLPMENFGCATQHNLAAMVADPHDLVVPRRLGPSDASERSQMMQKYEAGQVTTAAQPPQASAQISD